jgi:Na+/melibiose symporter-like transporter
MSLVINISSSQQRRDSLVSKRNAFTYIAGISILALMSILFASVKSPLKQFQIMVYIVTATGVALSFFYLVGVPEVKLSKQSKYHDEIY